MNDKLLSLLGFAAKAGRLSFGAAASLEAVKAKKSKLVLICCDISQKSQKEMLFHCEKTGVKAMVMPHLNIETVSGAVGRSCGVLSVNDSSFANQAINLGGNANEK